jgi:hypothetical protein
MDGLKPKDFTTADAAERRAGTSISTKPFNVGKKTGASNITKGKPKYRSTLPALPGPLRRQYLTTLSNIRSQGAMGQISEQNAFRDAMLGASQARQQAGRMAAGGMADLMGSMSEAGIGTSPAISQIAIDQQAAQEAGARMAAERARVQALQDMADAAYNRNVSTQEQMVSLNDWAAQQRMLVANQQLQNLLKGGK